MLAKDQYREIIGTALSHRSYGVERTAIEVTPRDEAGRDMRLATDVFASADAQVRLAALLALAGAPEQRPALADGSAAALGDTQLALLPEAGGAL